MHIRKRLRLQDLFKVYCWLWLSRFECQKNVNNFRTDLYLPDQKIATEIDENNHAYRDPIYEQEREQYIRLQLGCECIRINLDAEHFKLSSFIGKIMRAIMDA